MGLLDLIPFLLLKYQPLFYISQCMYKQIGFSFGIRIMQLGSTSFKISSENAALEN